MSIPNVALLARLVADDPRADSGKREVVVAADAITIDRCVAGVRMRIAAPVRSYRGVALSVQEGLRGFFYRLALVHADPDLDVILSEAESEAEVAPQWRAWAQFFGLPRLMRSLRGADKPVEQALGEVSATLPQPRRRGWPLKGRRSAISARRKAGAGGRVLPMHRGEREIICYE